MMISQGTFFFFSKFCFFGLLYPFSRAKNSPKWLNILSVVLHISEAMHYMIVICGTQVQNDNISRCVCVCVCVCVCFFFHFFKILIFWAVRRVKRQKMAQNDKKLCPSSFISQEPYIIWSSFHFRSYIFF